MDSKEPVDLNSVRVAAPCSADWNKMKGDDCVRFCSLCQKNVYNLSALSKTDAENLIREKEGRMCVQFYQRKDGTMLTDNCPIGVKIIRRRLRIIGTAAAACLTVIGGFVGARMMKAAGVPIRQVEPFATLQQTQPVKVLVDWIDPQAIRGEMVMGKMAPMMPVTPLVPVAPTSTPNTPK